jgi:hypothetical protein
MGLRRRYPCLSSADIVVAVEMYESGQSLATIGSLLGVAPGTVLRMLKIENVRIRGRNGYERDT